LDHWQIDEGLPYSKLFLEEGEIRAERQKSFTNRMSQGIAKKSFPKTFFTTLLNTQRAIYQSYDYLFSAIQIIFPVNDKSLESK
jgi:hypothetical protein